MKKFNLKKTAVAAALLTGSTFALAGSGDTDFGTTVTKLTGWMEGTLGQTMALGSLAVGLGVGIVKQSVMAVATGVGMALAASVGPGILTGIFAAAL